MSGKMKKRNLKPSFTNELKSLTKTELAIVTITSDGKKFINEYKAIIHESSLYEQRETDRRWNQMKTKIAELVCQIIKEKQWGIFFKNEPMQALPVQNNTSIYRINEVKDDELMDAIQKAMDERIDEWQNHQADSTENQTDSELSSGTNQTLSNTEE